MLEFEIFTKVTFSKLLEVKLKAKLRLFFLVCVQKTLRVFCLVKSFDFPMMGITPNYFSFHCNFDNKKGFLNLLVSIGSS